MSFPRLTLLVLPLVLGLPLVTGGCGCAEGGLAIVSWMNAGMLVGSIGMLPRHWDAPWRGL